MSTAVSSSRDTKGVVVEDVLRVMASRLPRGQARAWEGEVYDARGAILF